jgi:uncharacterized membrane protein
LKIGRASPPRLGPALGTLLHYGTLLASAVVASGLALAPGLGAPGMRVATAGLVLFILLPVVRVGVMLMFFLRAGDYKFGAIAALVLSIILLSFFLGAP